MGPLSAVAISVTFILFGLDVGTWATINAKTMGVIFIIAAVLVILDVFWAHRSVFVRNPPS
jgi:hypothetical protein